MRDYVWTAFADPDAVLVVDGTGGPQERVWGPSVCNANTPVLLTALIENPRLCSPKFLTCEQWSV